MKSRLVLACLMPVDVNDRARREFDAVIVNREIHAAAEELVTLMTGPLGPTTPDDL